MSADMVIAIVAFTTIIGALLIVIISSVANYIDEVKEFNNGRCKICGRPLRLAKPTEYGRVYSCDWCRRNIVITNGIDHEYLKRMK